MHEAIYNEGNLLISADRAASMVLRNEIDRCKFTCYGCGVGLCLCSFKETNKVRPHFAIASKKIPHSPKCPVKLAESRGRGKVTEGTVGLPIIDALVLDSSEDKRCSNRKPSHSRQTQNKPRQESPRRSRGNRNSFQKTQAGDLRCVVQQYARNLRLRNHPLSIPGVDANTYGGCFQPIDSPWDRRTRSYPKTALTGCFIYFGTLKFTSEPLVQGDHYTYQFIQQASCQPEGTQYSLQIDMADWNSHDKYLALDEIERARSAARKAWKEKKKELFLVFFLGDLDSGDTHFRVNDSCLICAASTVELPKLRHLFSENHGRVPEIRVENPANISTREERTPVNQTERPKTKPPLVGHVPSEDISQAPSQRPPQPPHPNPVKTVLQWIRSWL